MVPSGIRIPLTETVVEEILENGPCSCIKIEMKPTLIEENVCMKQPPAKATRLWRIYQISGSVFGRDLFADFCFRAAGFFFFSDFVAGFLLFIFAGNNARKSPPGKSPPICPQFTTKSPTHLCRWGRGNKSGGLGLSSMCIIPS